MRWLLLAAVAAALVAMARAGQDLKAVPMSEDDGFDDDQAAPPRKFSIVSSEPGPGDASPPLGSALSMAPVNVHVAYCTS